MNDFSQDASVDCRRLTAPQLIGLFVETGDKSALNALHDRRLEENTEAPPSRGTGTGSWTSGSMWRERWQVRRASSKRPRKPASGRRSRAPSK